MKKIKLDGRLSLNKETITTLNSDQMNGVKGGEVFLTIGKKCKRTKLHVCCPQWPKEDPNP